MILGVDGRLANTEQAVGAGRYCREILGALSRCGDGVALRVYLDRPPVESFPLAGDSADIRVLRAAPFWTHHALARELRREPPDLFYSPTAQLPLGCPCPAIVSVLDMAAWRFPESFPWRKRWAMRAQAGHAIRWADRCIAISESTATDIADMFGVPVQRMKVAHPGCDSRFFTPENPAGESVLDGLPQRFVLYVGQLQPRKNLSGLIAAFGKVRESHPDLPHHLVIAGSHGWMRESIQRAATASPHADRIHFLEYVPESVLPALMARADVLALVSRWEGFGLPALEAMAAGTAVLASDRSALPEVVGDVGVLVNPDQTEAIAAGLGKLLRDEALRWECEQRGRQRARGFTWDKTATAIATCARELCAEGAG